MSLCPGAAGIFFTSSISGGINLLFLTVGIVGPAKDGRGAGCGAGIANEGPGFGGAALLVDDVAVSSFFPVVLALSRNKSFLMSFSFYERVECHSETAVSKRCPVLNGFGVVVFLWARKAGLIFYRGYS